MSSNNNEFSLNLKIWRQKNKDDAGKLESYRLDGISPDQSFLEMMDMLNENLVKENKEPVSFDHDCREGICGACSMMVNGQAHGPWQETTTCQLHMRAFHNDQTVFVEPWRAKAFPVLKDLMVDRSAFDEIISAGGYVSVNTGNAPDASSLLVPKENAETAMDAAACIGCGACVAACPNASAMLFVGAKITHLASLPQGEVEKNKRASSMVAKMDELGFGNCTNTAECEASCPKGIKITNIATMVREYTKAKILSKHD